VGIQPARPAIGGGASAGRAGGFLSGRTVAQSRIATAALMIATAMQAGDATIVNVVLPHLEHDFGGGIGLGAWVMTSYLCANAVVAPLSGWLSRRYGARRLFNNAVGIFVLASMLCAVAPSAPAIIAFRIIQGAAGGVIHPMAQAILLDIHPKEKHGWVLGMWGAAAMAGPILGPALGGIITDLASWRWAFAINLPIGALILLGTWRVVPQRETNRELPIDSVGIVLLIAAIGALQLFLERSVGTSWLDSPELAAEASIAVLAVVIIAMRARRLPFTLLRLDVFKDVNFAVSAFYNFVMSALLFTAVVFIPALGQGPLGYPATVAGLTIVPRAVLMMLVMLAAGRMVGKVNYRILLASGWVLMAAGLAMLSAIPPDRAIYLIIAGSTVQALGAGLLMTPLSSLAFSTLPAERRADAAGLYSLLRQLGCACGVALMTAVLSVKLRHYVGDLAPAASGGSAARTVASLRAYAECFRLMAIVSMIVAPGIVLFRLEPAADPVKETA
jgi:DHA2 family multidrug resistance protein